MNAQGTEPRPLLVTVEEAARLLRIGRTAVYELLGSQAIARVKVGKSTRIVLADLERWVREQGGIAA